MRSFGIALLFTRNSFCVACVQNMIVPKALLKQPGLRYSVSDSIYIRFGELGDPRVDLRKISADQEEHENSRKPLLNFQFWLKSPVLESELYAGPLSGGARRSDYFSIFYLYRDILPGMVRGTRSRLGYAPWAMWIERTFDTNCPCGLVLVYERVALGQNSATWSRSNGVHDDDEEYKFTKCFKKNGSFKSPFRMPM